jgi:predicted molibdopterin-dependent oxidoreductase YjgC
MNDDNCAVTEVVKAALVPVRGRNKTSNHPGMGSRIKDASLGLLYPRRTSVMNLEQVLDSNQKVCKAEWVPGS